MHVRQLILLGALLLACAGCTTTHSPETTQPDAQTENSFETEKSPVGVGFGTGGITSVVEVVYADISSIAVKYSLYSIPGSISNADPAIEDYWVNITLQTRYGIVPNEDGGFIDIPANSSTLTKDGHFFYGESVAGDMLDVVFRIEIRHQQIQAQGDFNNIPWETVYSFEVPMSLKIMDSFYVSTAVDQTVTANGFDMTLKDLTIKAHRVEFNLCYAQPPGEQNWVPRLDFEVNGSQEPIRPMWTDFYVTDKAEKDDPPCRLVSVNLNTIPSSEAVTIRVSKLIVDFYDQPGSEERLARAVERLAAQGIKAEFLTSDPFVTWEVIEKPEQMDLAEADGAVHDALSDQIEGPWEFTVSLAP